MSQDSTNYQDTTSNGHLTTTLIIAVFLVTFGTNFQIYNEGVVNNLEDIVRNWMNETYQQRYGQILNGVDSTILWSALASMPQAGATLSAFLIIITAEKLGRKLGLIIVAGITVASSLLPYFVIIPRIIFSSFFKKSKLFE